MSADGPGAVRRALDRACASLRTGRRALTRFAPRPSAFSPAPDAEAAAVRAVRNLRTFRVHYAVIQWALLLASLAPRHRASMLFLMAASKGLLLYGGLLRAFPNSALLRRLLDRRLVAAVFVVLVVADLAAAHAIPNLLFALAAGAPVVVLHAAFRVRDDLEPAASPDSAGGEEDKDKERTGVVVEKKEDGDVETGPTRRSATAAAAKS
ncbi:PRA1 family protein B2-like [Hordeum vulgare]|uniref:PRA1 family protein n=1 Tax=Hordeum vulgare subsp. vulgare TaxID=112509 RepID=A0A8I6Y5F1_HORVV|nr:PRA1 family protein B2-like [Hordeum vulgare subsp. vulgare]KAE8818485.1 PRA1 family protein B2-like [Hordeum vulgare]